MEKVTTGGGATSLISAVETRIRDVRTRSQDVSFNELYNMYREGDLKIRPEYQRLFRWDVGKQSRFIESIILEMPVPPIFVIEDELGRYELIDGLQRMSTYLHFRGELEAPHIPIVKGEHLVLVDCDIVRELDGLTYRTLPAALEIKLKRHFIRVEVIRKESDPRLRYYMFKRLNTGGEDLTAQEVRNCTIRMLDASFIEFVARLSREPSFKTCISPLTDDARNRLYDQELVLRFFAFRNDRARYRHEVGEFMTEYMERVAAGELAFDYTLQEHVFLKTFRLLEVCLGENAFAYIHPSRGSYVQQFSSYHFEAFTLGLQSALEYINEASSEDITRLRNTLDSIKRDVDFQRISKSGGKNFAIPLRERIEFVEQRVKAAFPQ
jgi:hypothetical protein